MWEAISQATGNPWARPWLDQPGAAISAGGTEAEVRAGGLDQAKEAGRLGSRGTRLRGTNGFLHAPPVAPDAGPGARERCARSEEDRLHHPIRAAGSSVTPDRRRSASVRYPRCESIDGIPCNGEYFNEDKGLRDG